MGYQTFREMRSPDHGPAGTSRRARSILCEIRSLPRSTPLVEYVSAVTTSEDPAMSEHVDYIYTDAESLERRALDLRARIRKAGNVHLEKQVALIQQELDRFEERLKGHRLGYEEFLRDVFTHTADECGLLAF